MLLLLLTFVPSHHTDMCVRAVNCTTFWCLHITHTDSTCR